MEIKVPLENNYLPDQFSKYASDKDKSSGTPIRSFPISLSEVPQGTKTLAIVMYDHDAIPVSGFTYIHWVAANLDGSLREIPENASQSGQIPMTYGNNSTAGGLINNSDTRISQHYNGPTPPDKPHRYTLLVYALDQKLPLKNGFWLNQFYDAAKGHILAQAKQVILAKN
mgnify:CR=1 FL=1